MDLGSIAPLTDHELLSLAQSAKIHNSRGWAKFRALTLDKIRGSNLSDISVIESITEYLVRRPLDESEKIKFSICDDIKAVEKQILELEKILIKVNIVPTEKQIQFILNQVTEKLINPFTSEILTEVLNSALSYKNLSLHRACGDYYLKHPGDLIADISKMLISNVILDIRRKKCETIDSIIECARKSIVDGWSDAFKRATKVFESTSPLVIDLYVKQAEDVLNAIDKLNILLEDLKKQLLDINAITGPIEKMAKDLDSYLKIVAHAESIYNANNLISSIESRSMERLYAISALSHYSSIAIEALSEVKNTLSSYHSAQRELGVSTLDVSGK